MQTSAVKGLTVALALSFAGCAGGPLTPRESPPLGGALVSRGLQSQDYRLAARQNELERQQYELDRQRYELDRQRYEQEDRRWSEDDYYRRHYYYYYYD